MLKTYFTDFFLSSFPRWPVWWHPDELLQPADAAGCSASGPEVAPQAATATCQGCQGRSSEKSGDVAEKCRKKIAMFMGKMEES